MAGTLWMEKVGGVWLLRVSGQSWLFLDVLQACRKGSSRNVFRVGNGGSFQAVSQHCSERAGSVNQEALAVVLQVEVLQLVILRLW